jgi:hypothetical protein
MLKVGDLVIERAEALAGDGLPFVHSDSVEDSVDLVEGQAGVLEHADEDKPAEGLGSIAPLARLAGVWTEESLTFVVAHDGGGDLSPLSHLTDREQIRHGTQLT